VACRHLTEACTVEDAAQELMVRALLMIKDLEQNSGKGDRLRKLLERFDLE
jgi:hypothetical protein